MKRFFLFTALMLLCFTALDAQTPRQSPMLENGHAVGRASEYQKTAWDSFPSGFSISPTTSQSLPQTIPSLEK